MRIRFTSGPGTAAAQEHEFFKKIENVQIKRKINVMATFLPEEITKDPTNRQQEENYVGVLLNVYIFGLPQLTEKYNTVGKGGIYRLTATLNAYLGSMIEIAHVFNGDILKFYGDKMCIVWKVLPNESLNDILNQVVECALIIRKQLSNFDTELNITLTINITITSGNMRMCIIGDEEYKSVLIVDGFSDLKMGAILKMARNDIFINSATWAHMAQEQYESMFVEKGVVKIYGIVFKRSEDVRKQEFVERCQTAARMVQIHMDYRNYIHSMKKIDSQLSENSERIRFLKLLPRRSRISSILSHWVVDQLRPYIVKVVQNQIDENQPVEYIAEKRMITVQCIQVILDDDIADELILLSDRLIRDVNKLVTTVLGVITEVQLYSSQIRIMVLFGLRGVNHEMESQNALTSSSKIKHMLENMIGIDQVTIGVTNGLTFCGAVGHPFRREFLIVGKTYSQAVRIVKLHPNKIICDYKTFKHAKLSSFYFLLISNKPKQWNEPAYIYEYNEMLDIADMNEGDTRQMFGRDSEYNLLRMILYNDDEVKTYYGVCLHGPRHIGKTIIVTKFMDDLRLENTHNIASISLNDASNIPYFAVLHIYRQLYDNCSRLNYADINLVLNLPRDLWDYHEDGLVQEDIALQKYRILNRFRTAVKCSLEPVVIFIDEVHNIDAQSWEVLEIALNDGDLRLIMSGYFDKPSWDLKFKMSLHDNIKLVELRGIDPNDSPNIICQFLGVKALPNRLNTLIVATCEGKPGYIQMCLLRLMNLEYIELKLINRNELSTTDFIFSDSQDKKKVIPIIQFTENRNEQSLETSVAATSLDLLDSFPLFEQLVIKTAAVLGNNFMRHLLIIALKYPEDMLLAKTIKYLFEEEIFECGCTFIYGAQMGGNPLCCKCNFNVDEYVTALPKYAWCKVLHFRNRTIRDVAYNLTAENQRRELHILCTNVIENMNHQCPKCLRDPINSYIHIGKFNQMIDYCTDTLKPIPRVKFDDISRENVKPTIKSLMLKDEPGQAGYSNTVKSSASDKDFFNFDTKNCNCYEILARVYKELIRHSECAGHSTKRIFFTMKYGFVLICMNDLAKAISVLSEARELCMVDAKTPDSNINEVFRKVHVGKIEFGLARACINLRQYRRAKDHIAIALRQYCLPSVSLSYKPFSWLITRPFMLKKQNNTHQMVKNTIAKFDIGVCLSICSKLFALEGNWRLAKLSCSYSLCILKSINPNLSILMDVYATAIDLYNHCNEIHVCQELQRFAAKDIQRAYAGNLTFNLYSLNSLLTSMFQLRIFSNDLYSAIRMGYRILDINLKLLSNYWNSDIMVWLSILLLYVFRLKESGEILNFIRLKVPLATTETHFSYYAYSLFYYLRSGFLVAKVEHILAFADIYYERKVKFNWDDIFFTTLISIYYIRLGRYHEAEEWRRSCSFIKKNVASLPVFKALSVILEYKFYILVRSRRLQNATVVREEKVIRNLLNLMKDASFKYFKLFIPMYFTMLSWFCMITQENRAALMYLKKGYKEAERSKNSFAICRLLQLQNSFRRGYAIAEDNRPPVYYWESSQYNMKQFAQFMPANIIE